MTPPLQTHTHTRTHEAKRRVDVQDAVSVDEDPERGTCELACVGPLAAFGANREDEFVLLCPRRDPDRIGAGSLGCAGGGALGAAALLRRREL